MRARRPAGELVDVMLAADGTIASVVVATPEGREELDNGADVGARRGGHTRPRCFVSG